jgi:hypothetical protein
VSVILRACSQANEVLQNLGSSQPQGIKLFEIFDLRMLSGLVGEIVVGHIAEFSGSCIRNPNIDGYPDLICADTASRRAEISHALHCNPSYFVQYPHGGIELKNTFGTKGSGASDLLPGMTRVHSINRRLQWKAHHRRTNFLLGLFSDFIDGCPQVVAAMFSDSLAESDWSVKQEPKRGSAMTSFTVLQSSGHDKMRSRLLVCRDDPAYQDFFFAQKSPRPIRRSRPR